MPTDSHSKSQGLSLEEVAQAISNALWAMIEKFFKKEALLRSVFILSILAPKFHSQGSEHKRLSPPWAPWQ